MSDEPRESDAHAVPPVTEAETDMAAVRLLRPFAGAPVSGFAVSSGLAEAELESIAGRSRHDELVAEIEDLRLSSRRSAPEPRSCARSSASVKRPSPRSRRSP